MRVLLDYRPALRQRSGVGEYAHELARGLMALFPGDPAALSLTLFSSSWKDRLILTEELEKAGAVDRRIPVRLIFDHPVFRDYCLTVDGCAR